MPLIGRLSENTVQRRQLCFVPYRGTGRMSLEQLHRRRRTVCIGIGPCQRQPLTFRTRRIDTLRPAVAGRADTANHRVHAVPVALGVGKTLQREHADALTDQRAVSGIVEGPDTPGS